MEPTTLTAAGASIVCALGAIWCWRLRRKSAAMTQQNATAALAVASDPDFDQLAEAVSQLVAEIQNAAQKNIDELSLRIERMAALIAKADEKINALSALQTGEALSIDDQGGENKDTANEDSWVESGPLTLSESARLLADETLDEVEIARRLGVSRGEVRLLLTLEHSKATGGAG
jgi:hypothetical protein